MGQHHRIRVGEHVFCRELNTGENRTGTFLFDGSRISVRFVSFERARQINSDEVLILTTETSDVISLHNNFTLSHAISSPLQYGATPISKQEIASNLAIVGPDPWREHDLIKRVCFTISGSMIVLRNDVALEKFQSFPRPEDYDWRLFRIRVGDMTLTTYYTGEYTSEINSWREVEPEFQIEFDEPIQLSEYEKRIMPVSWFFSFLTATPLFPENIRISRLSEDEFSNAVATNRFLGEHSIITIRAESHRRSDEGQLFGAPANATTAEELNALIECLTAWVRRTPEWFDAYILMNKAQLLQHRIGDDRVLSLCRWLEKIPTARSVNTLPQAQLDHLIKLATDGAKELGRDDLKARIEGALRYLKTESNKERYARLIELAWQGINLHKDAGITLEEVSKIDALRGIAAHGTLMLETEEDFKKITYAIHSLESICFLLMARDLPMSHHCRAMLRHYKYVENYRILR